MHRAAWVTGLQPSAELDDADEVTAGSDQQILRGKVGVDPARSSACGGT